MQAAARIVGKILGKIAVPAAALAVSACGSSDDSVVRIAFIGNPGDPFQTGVYLPPSAQLIHAATAEGLVGFDTEGRVVPALADRWIVTDDGLSYIFRLRDGTWRDGSELTAQSARVSLREKLRALRGSSLGLDLAGIDETRVMAERVIEIRLARPMPNLLQLLAQPELGLSRKGKGAGPMSLSRRAGVALLTPIAPEQVGMPTIENWENRTRVLRLTAMPASQAVERFNDGGADLMLGGTIADFPLARSVGLLRGTIQVDPVSGLLGLSVLNDKGFLGKPANREALVMAIDRSALIEPFGISGWKSTTRVVAPGTEGDTGAIAERWNGIDIAARKAQAAARVAAWNRSGDGPGPVGLTVSLPQGEGGDLLLKALRKDFADIGIALRRAAPGDRADLELIDDVARYPRMTWYLNRLSCKARKSLCSRDADARVDEAMATDSPATRAALLAEAEAELTKENVYIPIGVPIRWSLVSGDVSGFAPNPFGWHPLMPMAIRPK